ncbi:amidase family protein, partial [Rhizobium sp. CCGE 510]|uniref:amidase family protein n=1 Tax=Rhizobium sp. CCGE 510 TaxID=1132836 RepID=UPI00027B7D84
MTDNIAFQDVRSLKSMLRGGQITPSELVDTFAERIGQHNGLSKAFITTTIDAARAQAANVSRGDFDRSAFAGIPYASKDLFDVQGVLTTAGSKV